MNRTKCVIAAIATLALMLPWGASATLLSNGGFETGSSSSWTLFHAQGPDPDSSTADTYANFGIPAAPGGGTYALQIDFPTVSTAVGVYQGEQYLYSVPLSSSSQFELNFDWRDTVADPTASVQPRLIFYNTGGVYVGESGLGAGIATVANTWTHFAARADIPGSWDHYRLDVRVPVIRGAASGAPAQSWYLDNFTLDYVIPEPSTVLLLGLGTALAWRRLSKSR